MAGKVKTVVRRTGARFMGITVPALEASAGTAGGLVYANFAATLAADLAAKVSPAIAQHLSAWYGRAALKVGAGIVGRMVVRRWSPQYANALLGGSLASAFLTVGKGVLPDKVSRYVMAGVEEDAEAGFNGMAGVSLQRSVAELEARLAGVAGGLGCNVDQSAMGAFAGR